ncbi:helix-turn-helix transcriptional regulator [Microbacterium sp. LWO12-1.2]|uniref:helix-turn-helix transcriptional regulator n=1 Tax=Microbacterium sp. LWO12-1.2 TaxID=3135261 RepID=UPI003445CD8D
MFVRTDDLTTALRLITAGSCVSIVGPDGSGRSMLLREIAATLEQRGYPTTQIVGVESLRARPFEALDLAGEVPTGSSMPGARLMVTAMAERAAGRRSVLLVDDAPFVDEESWGVIAAVHARTGATIVTTSAAPREGGTKRLHAIVSQAAELRLRPLTFEAVSDLVHEQLGGAVDTGLVGRVYTRSAGIPSLAVAMITAARTFGHIASVDGTWTMTGELWHDSMSGAVEHLLAHADADELEAIEILALAGVLDIDTAEELVGRHLIESLEAASLLLSIEPFGRLSVTVTPPLISDYFQNRPNSVRRSRILRTIQDQFRRAGGPASRTDLLPGSAADASLEPDAAEMALVRLIRDRHAAQLSARRRAWERDPGVDTATNYLFTLFDGKHDPEVALQVFDRTPTVVGDGGARAMFRILQARWHALAAGETASALAILTAAAADQPRYETMLEVWATHLRIISTGVTPALIDRLATLTGRDATTADSIASVHSTALILRGRAESAHDLLRHADDTSTKIGRVLALLRGWALLGRGDVAEAHDWAVTHIEQSRVELDLENLRGHTYLAAVSGISLGRFRTAEIHLGRFLALGEPGLGQEGSQMGALALAAMLAARAGRLSSATSLAAQAAATGVAIGPWPGMVAALPDITFRLLDGDTVGAEQEIRAQMTALEARGYLLAAGMLRVLTAGFGAHPREAGETDAAMSTLEGTLVAPMLDMHAAIVHEDHRELERLGAWFAAQERLDHAVLAYEQGRDIALRRGEDASADRLTAALVGLRARRDPLDTVPVVGRSRTPADLSNREREVARLAAHGQSNQEIAEHLGISTRTVESHLLKTFRKLRVSGRAELAEFSWL